MCGFAGLLTARGWNEDAITDWVGRMIAPIHHRGPDSSGTWADAEAGIGLGFRRLAIIDLSENGHQPMTSATGRFVIVFNGEVYNHGQLRRELAACGHRFRGHSDTEVILAAFEEWGIEASTRRFIGMFAIAVWDRTERTLSLIRDRLGIKPVVVYARPGLVTFGSELKSLIRGPDFDRTVDPAAVSSYLRYLYVPAPQTVFQHAIKLLPGHILTIRSAAEPLPEPVPYWSAIDAADRGLAEPFGGTEAEAVDELERLLMDAVGLRMQADVPLGALLSGGIDSSTVVALMQKQATRPVRTYSIGFDHSEHNEAWHAARVAAYLGTDHAELHVDGDTALAVVPKLAAFADEPFADPSQIPTLLVCELARREVTVALSGDGGDELFAGYNRYVHGRRLMARVRAVPRGVRRLIATGIGTLQADRWDQAGRLISPFLPATARHRLLGQKVHKLKHTLQLDTEFEVYRSLVSAWQDPGEILLAKSDRDSRFESLLRSLERFEVLDRMMLVDQMTYLPDELLTKVDQMSMAVSLEARVPILDHRVVEFSWKLPQSAKLNDTTTKWALRQVLFRHVPREMIERPKVGFSVPLVDWLRGPLRGWAEDLLSSRRLKESGQFDVNGVSNAWQRFLRGESQRALPLWTILMYQQWQHAWNASA